MSENSGPAWLYLHGFASSPASTKARAFQAWGQERGLAIDALDLRVPTLSGLRFSAIKRRVRDAIDAHSEGRRGGDRARVVLIGSSLGGLTACRVAEEAPRTAGRRGLARTVACDPPSPATRPTRQPRTRRKKMTHAR